MRRFAAGLLVLLIVLSLTGCNSSDYRKAEKLFNGGSYEAAMVKFKKLGDYKDSPERVQICLDRMASDAVNNMDYKSAYLWYTQLLAYEDSRERASAGLYDVGKAAMDSSDWSLAANCFSKIKDYEDSAELYRQSSGKKSGSSFTDDAFLDSVTSSAVARMRSSAENDRRKLVTMEQGYVERYANGNFYDGKLKTLAQRYIAALHAELDSLSGTGAESEIAWQQAELERYEVINALYSGYGVGNGNESFRERYVDGLEAQRNTAEGLSAIEADISAQLKDPDAEESYDHVSVSLTNNTDYTYDLTAVFTFTYEVKGSKKVLETVTVEENGIEPGSSVLLWANRSSKSASATGWNVQTTYSRISK